MTDCCAVIEVTPPDVPVIEVEFGTTGLPGAIAQDAPADGKQYARINSTWEENSAAKTVVTPSGGIFETNTQEALEGIDTRVSAIEAGGSVTKATLTQTLSASQDVDLTLNQPVSIGPVVSVTIEVANDGLVNSDWDIGVNETRFDVYDSAYATTLTPSATSGEIVFTLGSGSFSASDIGKTITGNGGTAILVDVSGRAITSVAFNNTSAIASGNWSMVSGLFGASGFTVSGDVVYDAAPTYTGTSFSTASQTGGISDATIIDANFWVLDPVRREAYKYDSSGEYTGLKFSTTAQDLSPAGIEGDAGKYWIAGGATNRVYRYADNPGSYTGNTFQTDDDGSRGIAFDGTYFWVYDINDRVIRQYTSAGGYTGFSFSAPAAAEDLFCDGTSIFAVSNTTDDVREYDFSGNLVSSFSVSSEMTTPRAIVKYNNEFWITSAVDGAIYVYSSSGTYTGTFYFIVDGVGNGAVGCTVVGDKFWFNYRTAERLHEWDPATQALTGVIIDTSPETVSNPEGVAWDGSSFWVLGNTSDFNVYQYTPTPAYDGFSFNVASQLSEVRGVTVSDSNTLFVTGIDGSLNSVVREYTRSGSSLGSAFDISDISDVGSIHNSGSGYWIADLSSSQFRFYNYSGAFSGISFSSTTPAGLYTAAVEDESGAVWIANDQSESLYKYESQTANATITNTYIGTITNSQGTIDTSLWTDINSIIANETLNGGEAYYSFSNDNHVTWTVRQIGQGERQIVRNNGGTWEFNSNVIYQNTTWTAASVNDELKALEECLSEPQNRMSGSDLAALHDAEQFTLADDLDLFMGVAAPSSSNIPLADGVTINYDAQAYGRGAINGTDYTWIAFNDTTVRVTAITPGNYKIRVV